MNRFIYISIYLRILLLFISMCTFVACTMRTQQKNEVLNSDSTSIIDKNDELDSALIVLLIKEDEEKRNIWSYDFKESKSSSLFYEAICDDGLYLYRIVRQNQKISVVMLEDANVGEIEDFIQGYTDTTGVEYKHNGYYELVNDTTVNIFFDKLYSNYSYVNKSEIFDPIYHIKCMHSYRLSGAEWYRTKADTTIIVDERAKAFCEDIWKYTD